MSTIAAPREPSVNGVRRIPLLSTPTSSSRPSLDIPNPGLRSIEASPNRGPSHAVPPKRNRSALREYYNLQKKGGPDPSDPSSLKGIASSASSMHSFSDIIADSELDRADFDAGEYVKAVLENQTLEELLRTYNAVLGDIRALDGERKALVYDNYSKLIAATETIGRMRRSMEMQGKGTTTGATTGLGVGTLDPAVASVYERAERIKNEMREAMGDAGDAGRELVDRERVKKIVVRVLETPDQVRAFMSDGKVADARALWGSTSKTLERWRERGVGGQDVLDCIEDGEAALRGEGPGEKSWARIKNRELSSP